MEPKYNSFTTFVNLSPEEERASLTFSDYNLVFIQNERSRLALEALDENPDPEFPLKHTYHLIELQAQIKILGWIIDSVNAARAEALKAAQEAEMSKEQSSTLTNSSGV